MYFLAFNKKKKKVHQLFLKQPQMQMFCNAAPTNYQKVSRTLNIPTSYVQQILTKHRLCAKDSSRYQGHKEGLPDAVPDPTEFLVSRQKRCSNQVVTTQPATLGPNALGAVGSREGPQPREKSREKSGRERNGEGRRKEEVQER